MNETGPAGPHYETIYSTAGHLLILGGPGSGKTTVALYKAQRDIAGKRLRNAQRFLFLSFARATVTRVDEQAGNLISKAERAFIEINTYHSFCWTLLRSHGYLLEIKSPPRLLAPPDAAALLAEMDDDERKAEKCRLCGEDGLLHFDLFACKAAELLKRCKKLARIIANAYPTIILDEFQDTNADEWEMIQRLGEHSRLIALADPEQRIYEFRGADPRRIGEFLSAFSPTEIDFGAANHRSNGTDIVQFGDDVLANRNKDRTYKNVTAVRYGFLAKNLTHQHLKFAVFKAMKRQLQREVPGWSIAILVPSKRLMLDVSDYLSTKTGGLEPIAHDVAMDTEGPSLAAAVIAAVLDECPDAAAYSRGMVTNLCAHMRGRNGDRRPARDVLELTNALTALLAGEKVRGSKRKQIIDEMNSIVAGRIAMTLTGDPGEDWLAVRRLFEQCSSESLKQVAEDARYLRLLHKGAALRARLTDIWKTRGCYRGAGAAVRDALLLEHFSASTRTWSGVNVMTIHKSKGKEFDEVIIYEGRHFGKIVRKNATEHESGQARLSLRVAVTRARTQVAILTPANDVCPLL